MAMVFMRWLLLVSLLDLDFNWIHLDIQTHKASDCMKPTSEERKSMNGHLTWFDDDPNEARVHGKNWDDPTPMHFAEARVDWDKEAKECGFLIRCKSCYPFQRPCEKCEEMRIKRIASYLSAAFEKGREAR